MIAPGMIINSSNRIQQNSALDNVSDFIYGGFGFKNDGSLCFDTNGTPVGNFWVNGIRVNSTGCIYRKTLGAGDVWNSGLRMAPTGRLCVELANGTSFVSGNPLTANGVLALA